ncbi:hypothetical protein M438DRAFT_11484 [Aureobasidium pullulans EXF-150]|uniref:Uncharacterized protein n=1 Tax=Aureobasidium pullulans EXF-150 TaxID=1043002 RepID=A0A074XVR6_AURPU|nr:uncharacterized protein M438DRAFT_11484 [Aureobasidium pullulans EXF-150]KEQ89673.1 hypothetical protein M438DRAFT_11484 [Aureobasidium pullulans EXF-150]
MTSRISKKPLKLHARFYQPRGSQTSRESYPRGQIPQSFDLPAFHQHSTIPDTFATSLKDFGT